MQGFTSAVRSRKWVKRMLGLDHAIEEKRVGREREKQQEEEEEEDDARLIASLG